MKWIKYILIAIIPCVAQAGKEGGNGGYIQVCPQKETSSRYELYDFYEARNDEEIKLNLENIDRSKSYEEIFNYVIDKIKVLNPNRRLLYKKWYKTFFDDIAWTNESLAHSSDVGNGIRDNECRLEPLIIQRDPDHRKKRFKVNKILWDNLVSAGENYSLAGVILHEMIYRELREYQSDSISTRYLNAYFFSDEIKLHSLQEYIEQLRNEEVLWADAHGFKAGLYSGVECSIDMCYPNAQFDRRRADNPNEALIWEFYDPNKVEYASPLVAEYIDGSKKGYGAFQYSKVNYKGIENQKLYIKGFGGFDESSVTSRLLAYKPGGIKVFSCEIVNRNRYPGYDSDIEFYVDSSGKISSVHMGSNTLDAFCEHPFVEFSNLNLGRGQIDFDIDGVISSVHLTSKSVPFGHKGLNDFIKLSLYKNLGHGYYGIKSIIGYENHFLLPGSSKKSKCFSAEFHENGHMKSCASREPLVTYSNQELGTMNCKKIKFNDQGEFEGCDFLSPQKSGRLLKLNEYSASDIQLDLLFGSEKTPILTLKYDGNRNSSYGSIKIQKTTIHLKAEVRDIEKNVIELFPNGQIKKLFIRSLRYCGFFGCGEKKMAKRISKKKTKKVYVRNQWACFDKEEYLVDCK